MVALDSDQYGYEGMISLFNSLRQFKDMPAYRQLLMKTLFLYKVLLSVSSKLFRIALAKQIQTKSLKPFGDELSCRVASQDICYCLKKYLLQTCAVKKYLLQVLSI